MLITQLMPVAVFHIIPTLFAFAHSTRNQLKASGHDDELDSLPLVELIFSVCYATNTQDGSVCLKKPLKISQ